MVRVFFSIAEKTEKETEPTIAVTEVSKTVQETTSITESTTAAVTTSTTEKTTTPSFYDEILAYVGEENAPVLNENLDNNAMTIDSSTIDYSNKSMYTITTRSGDVFYLIINSDGSVYFLNPVDTADLTAMLSDSNDNKLNENALENIEQFESATENEKTVSSTETETIKNEKFKEESKNMKSTEKGYINKWEQRNNGRTNKPGTDNGQWFYEMQCLKCGHKYYANGTDIWERKCPECLGGRP